MSYFSQSTIDKTWKKGFSVDGLDPDDYRLDAAGGLMKKSLYGHEGNLGWEIDHIYPRSLLEASGIPDFMWDLQENLRPMNSRNNAAKGDDYPEYSVAVQYNHNSETPRNIAVEGKTMTVNDKTQEILNELYN